VVLQRESRVRGAASLARHLGAQRTAVGLVPQGRGRSVEVADDERMPLREDLPLPVTEAREEGGDPVRAGFGGVGERPAQCAAVGTPGSRSGRRAGDGLLL
jgi:hypothetical protein